MILGKVKDGALSIVSATEWCKAIAPFEGKTVEVQLRERDESICTVCGKPRSVCIGDGPEKGE